MSFNRGGFNRLRFNVGAGRLFKEKGVLDGGGDLNGLPSLLIPTAGETDSGASMLGTLTQTIDFESVPEGGADLAVGEPIAGKVFAGQMDGSAELEGIPIGVSHIHVDMNGGASLDGLLTQGITIAVTMDGGAELEGFVKHERLLEGVLDGGGDMDSWPLRVSSLSLVMDASGTLNGQTEQAFALSRDADSGAEITQTPLIQAHALRGIVDASGDIDAKIRQQFALYGAVNAGADVFVSLESVGTEVMFVDVVLQPGDILVIDTCRKKATLNGVNVREEVTGDWIYLRPESMQVISEFVGSDEAETKIDTVPRWI